MPFMMSLLLNKHRKVIIISPLKVLQVDQVWAFLISIEYSSWYFDRHPILTRCRFRQLAVNGDTWDGIQNSKEYGHNENLK
jgi:hypothetical protein